jgi:hypothetical protein
MTFLMPIILAIVLTLTALKAFPTPYLWISLGWFSCFVYLTFISKKPLYKHLWFNCVFLVALFGAVEGYSWLSPGSVRNEGGYRDGGYFSPDNFLGYAPAKGKTVDSIAYKGSEKIYSVTYTIGTDGLRVSPPSKSTVHHPCAVFFGDSFTFGEGVEDAEAMPYQVGKLSGFKIYNFGFHGYGPHQMLSAIEHGAVSKIVDCKSNVVIYQALTAHIERAAGLVPWDTHGPKYVLAQDGTLRYEGHFDDHSYSNGGWETYPILSRAKEQLDKSFIYQKYFKNRRREINESDVEVFFEIVDTSRKKFVKLYPGSEFHVILWNGKDPTVETIVDGLRKRGINLHLISDILPDFSERYASYIISPYDEHPNAVAYARIAEYVVRTILKPEPVHKSSQAAVRRAGLPVSLIGPRSVRQ